VRRAPAAASPRATSARGPPRRGGARARAPAATARSPATAGRGATRAQAGARGALEQAEVPGHGQGGTLLALVRSRARKRFMSRPVSMATGHEVTQVPSAAQVCTAS
jgi:hypothetical protein